MTHDESLVFDQVAALIEGASSICLSGHTDPDGDALGSVLGMVCAIETRWPGKRVVPLLANDRPAPEVYSFLPGFDRLQAAASFIGAPDLFISLDTPTLDRLRDSAAVAQRARSIVKFDHHPPVERFASQSVVKPEAASCGDIVFDFVTHCGIPIDRSLATCLLTAIITDTGRFQYQNADAHAHNAAAVLTAAGADASDICLNVYQSKTLTQLKLQKVVLDRLSVAVFGEVAYSYILRSDLENLGATDADCDELVDIVRSLRGIKAALFLRQKESGDFRGNLRAKTTDRDVSAVARIFGGGGHKAAAGFGIAGPIDQAIASVLEAYEAFAAQPGEGNGR